MKEGKNFGFSLSLSSPLLSLSLNLSTSFLHYSNFELSLSVCCCCCGSDVDFKLSPRSRFTCRNGENTTFLDYYFRKKQIVIEDIKQPLLVHGTSKPIEAHSTHNNSCHGSEDLINNSTTSNEELQKKNEEERNGEDALLLELKNDDDDDDSQIENNSTQRNFQTTVNSDKKKESSRHVLLIPEYCDLLAVTSEMYSYGRLIPTIFWHVSITLKLQILESQIMRISFSKRNRPLLRHAVTHRSYSSENEGPLTNYERLEFLGDAVLEYIISSRLFWLFPQFGEGKLTSLRTSLVSNAALSMVGHSLGLQHYLLFARKQKLDDSVRCRLTADIFEALLGAVYLEAGLERASQFYSDVIWRNNNPLSQLWRFPLNLLDSYTEMEVDQETKEKYQIVEERIGYRFQKKGLLVQAFTHPSYHSFKLPWRIRRHNYQRLEFLGDSLLDLISAIYLYKTFPTASEGQLTMCRAEIVNNETLAEVSLFMGLHELLRHNSSHLMAEGPRRTKVYADLFEALLGAIFVDMREDLSVCERLVTEFLINRSKVDPNKIVVDPKSLYQHLLQCEGKGTPTYKVLSVQEQQEGELTDDRHSCRVFEVGVFAQGLCMATATSSSSIKVAQKAAALTGIDLYLRECHYQLLDTDTQSLSTWSELKQWKQQQHKLAKP